MTHDEAFATMAGALVYGSDGRLRPETVDAFGTQAYAIATAGAFGAVELSWQLEERYRAVMLSLAAGLDLQELGFANYDTEIHGASAPVVTLQLSRTVTAGAFEVPAGSPFGVPGGPQFATDYAVEFADGDPGPKSVVATGLAAGSDQAAAAGTITSVGFGQVVGLTVTNAARTAGANDEEEEDAYRERIRVRPRTAAKGILQAIEEAASAVAQVRTVKAFELLQPTGRPFGVELFIGDRSGASNSALVEAVTARLYAYRAAGAYVVVRGSTPRLVTARVRVTWATGKATPANRRLVVLSSRARVADLVPNPGGTGASIPAACILTPGLLDAAARAVGGVEGVEVLEPVGAVVPARGEVLRLGAIEVV